MKKSFYLFNPERLSRKDNMLCFLPVDEEGSELQPRYLPIETVNKLYCFGSLDGNNALCNFLDKNQVAVHLNFLSLPTALKPEFFLKQKRDLTL